jgi:hypothetical protein
MSEPGTIPANREQKWVLWVNPSKGVAKEADKLIQERYKVGGSDPKDSFSPRGWSPTVSDFSLVTGAITAVAFGKDFYNGYKGISLPANTPASTSRAMIVRPKISPAGVSAGLRNILTSNDPVTNFRPSSNPLKAGNRLRTLGRGFILLNTVLCARSIYQDLTRAEDLDRKYVVDFDQNAKTLNSTAVANNSGLISGDYKAANFSFKVNNGKIEMGQSNSPSEASTEQEAKRIAITDSEKEYKSEDALETLNEILTLARKNQDDKARDNLKSFLDLVDVNKYDGSKKEQIIQMKKHAKLIVEAQQNPVAVTTSSPSPSAPAHATPVDLSFIDKLPTGPAKDALIEARKDGYLNHLGKFTENHKKINELKRIAKLINGNLTPPELNVLDTITLP